MIDVDAIVDRVSKKDPVVTDEAEETTSVEQIEEEYSESTEADKHLGEAYESFKRGDKQGFISAMKMCLGAA
jgi:hypothetical protein